MVCHSSLALSLWEGMGDVSAEKGCGSRVTAGDGAAMPPPAWQGPSFLLPHGSPQAPSPAGDVLPTMPGPRVCQGHGDTRVPGV